MSKKSENNVKLLQASKAMKVLMDNMIFDCTLRLLKADDSTKRNVATYVAYRSDNALFIWIEFAASMCSGGGLKEFECEVISDTMKAKDDFLAISKCRNAVTKFENNNNKRKRV